MTDISDSDLLGAMSPICRIIAARQYDHPSLRVGELYEVTEDDEDLWAVADGQLWISMCGVWCEPANGAARDLWSSMGWEASNGRAE